MESTTVVRLVVGTDEAVHDTATVSFLFPGDIGAQVAPDDWPTAWQASYEGGPFAADYEVEVADAEAFELAFADTPVVSIVLPPEALFDPETGIHEFPMNEGSDWERAASVEWFTRTDTDGFTEPCGLRMQGGAGRYPDRISKKSFRLLWKSEYGETKLRYPVYGDGVESFDSLILRGRYNRSWHYWDAIQRVKSTYMRERYVADIARDMGHLAPRGRHAHVFLNGLYWGLYLVQERPEGEYLASHLGGQEEDYDALNSGSPVDGDAETWNLLVAAIEDGFTTDEAWSWAQENVDLVNLADYVLIETFFGNIDWPEKNFYAGRLRDGGQWIWFVWDSELTMVNSTDNTFAELVNGVPGQLFVALGEQDDFRMLFADRVRRHAFNDGELTGDRLVERWYELAAEVRPRVEAESARWGDNRADHWDDGDVTYGLEHWDAERERSVDIYLSTRTGKALTVFEDEGWYPTLPAPEVVTTSPLELDGPGWATWVYTLDGTDPRLPGGELSPDALVYEGPVDSDGTGLFARALSGLKWSASLER
ncbi:MAG: hypothetical protein GY913_25400 [Proteobacteria bacterium]|nr:hypothetical protein [Pseudomonadota bacterium]MCP4920250.1 hypothetical protein [Pseudomonadota bacterium]